ncbi:basic amino acid ABC transporter substrate-binding protein [Desulfovibrio intestinalis]|uniref:Polar amino acid transport system substrate-binding protein n=1 Tax=Desulfovibrio intestinalis TaxID=58621 RepID=A0A7W8C1M9_9BACT|nr:basic amino acid ABC transporter substrate-binding protein [Desulfovibrio intestinalis]MBB5142035.1 polar amino acid transport system substrate-binding protein [Desulfovibrio intestinalis]
MIRRLTLTLLALALLCGQAVAAEKYVVATDCTWPPMELLDENKQPVGFDIDFITAVGKAAGFEVDVRNIAWDGIFGGVATGQYDIVASATTITPERQKQFDFSDPYYEVAQSVVLPAGQSIKSLEDLKGKKVGGQIGTTGVFVIRKSGVPVDLKEYDDVGLAIQDMLGGRLDAVICDDPVAMYYANKKADTAGKLNLSFKTDEKEYYGFTVRKGRKDLVEKLNKGIKEVKASGVEAKLLDKWMGASK